MTTPTPASSPTTAERARVSEQFDDPQQETEARIFGFWLFLITEAMLFGGLFTVYMVYRYIDSTYTSAFVEASRDLDLFWGTVNTGVLLTSSLTMALAIWAARAAKGRLVFWLVAATIVLGSAFLGIKFYEYAHKYHEGLVPILNWPFHGSGDGLGAKKMFYTLYFTMTGIHALHMVLGIAVLLVLLVPAWKEWFGPENFLPLEMTGLYWHFVDLVWVFLFPLLYLIDRS
ncbi:MAG: cytochrome c oxidase subunit 3 [Pirellulales bacterium]